MRRKNERHTDEAEAEEFVDGLAQSHSSGPQI